MADMVLRGLKAGNVKEIKKEGKNTGYVQDIVVMGQNGAKVFSVYTQKPELFPEADKDGKIEIPVDVQEFCFAAG